MRKPRQCIFCTLLTRRQRKIWCGVASIDPLSVTKPCLPSQHLSHFFEEISFHLTTASLETNSIHCLTLGILVATSWIIERCGELTQTVPWLSISGLLGGLLFLPQGVANSLLLRIVVGSRLAMSLSNNACGFEPFALPVNHADAVHSHLSPCFLAFSALSALFCSRVARRLSFFPSFSFCPRNFSRSTTFSLSWCNLVAREMGENVTRRGPASAGKRWFCTIICQACGKVSENACAAAVVTCSWSASCNPRPPKKSFKAFSIFNQDIQFPNTLDNQMVSS